jgi:hypothetical protein
MAKFKSMLFIMLVAVLFCGSISLVEAKESPPLPKAKNTKKIEYKNETGSRYDGRMIKLNTYVQKENRK